MIDLNEMVIFAAVVDAGSFTEAGKQLELPKSTISRKVSQLEKRLGVLLLQRTTRSLKLTEAGSAYYRHCARIISEAKEADTLAAQEQVEPNGLIRITAPPGFTFVTGYIAEFLEKYEKVQIELNLEKRMVDLVAEGYDLAFRPGPLKSSSLVVRYLGSSGFIMCASPDYLNQHGRPTSFADLENHQLIQGVPWRVIDHTGDLPLNLPKRVSTNENEVARLLTLEGLGISILPEYECAEEIRQGSLELVLPEQPIPAKKIYMLYPSKQYLSIKLRRFIDFIVENWKANPPW